LNQLHIVKDLWKIYRLQAYENELLELGEKIRNLDPGKEFERKKNEVLDNLQSHRDKLDNNKKRIKLLNLEIGSMDQQIKTSENKLYGGKTTNPKELAQLQKELKNLKSKREVLDEETLTLIYDNEELEDRILNLEKDYKVVEEEYKKYLEEYQKILKELNDRIEDVENKKNKIKEASSPELLNIYEDLKSRLGGLAIVSVQRNFCGGCGMTLSGMLVERVKSKMSLQYCQHCGRILYWEGEKVISHQTVDSNRQSA